MKSITGPGIYAQICASTKVDYNTKVTLKDLQQFLTDMTSYQKERSFIALTGTIGMVVFDLTLQGMPETEWINNSISFTTYSKYTKDIIISTDLIVKHGLYKALARRMKDREYIVEVRKGTMVIGSYNTFKEAFDKWGYPAKIK